MRYQISNVILFLLVGLLFACGDAGPLSQKALNGTWKLDSYRRAREKKKWKAGVKHTLENRATSFVEGALKFDDDDFQMMLHSIAVAPGYRQQVSNDTLSGTYSIEDSIISFHIPGDKRPGTSYIYRNLDTLLVKEIEHTMWFIKLPDEPE